MLNIFGWELPFTETELKMILIALGVLVFLVLAYVIFFAVWRKHQRRKLCTKQLTKKREELLAELSQIGDIVPASAQKVLAEDAANKVAQKPEELVVTEEVVSAEEEKVAEEIVVTEETVLKEEPTVAEEVAEAVVVEDAAEAEDSSDEDESEDDSDDENVVVTTEESENGIGTTVIRVKEMTRFMRRALEVSDAKYDNASFYAQCKYSFEAKLRLADEETKERYKKLRNEIALYKNLKVRSSFKQERVYFGRKTLALLMFRGKTLCIALALNPSEYAETKYRGLDKSGKKRFENTPMLFKITSNRKLEYAKYLLLQLAEKNTILMNEDPQKVFVSTVALPLAELFEREIVRVTLLGQVPETVVEETPAEVEEAVEAEDSVEAEESVEVEEVEAEAEDNDDEDSDNAAAASEGSEGGIGATVIRVKEMTDVMRRRLEIADSKWDNASFYAQCKYSFEAKLRTADEETKGRYKKLRDEIAKYKNVKVKSSFKQERVYFGRKTLALLMFRGKTLCIALALNPSEYAETKYRGLDKSGKKRFENTPMLFRVTSSRKLEYAKYLLAQIAERNGIVADENAEKVFVNSVSLPLAELFEREIVRVTLLGPVEGTEIVEAPLEEVIEEVAEDVEEPEEAEEAEAEAEDNDDGEGVAASVGNDKIGAIVLPVRQMTVEMRIKLGVNDAKYNDKSFYAQCHYSFEAKLRTADEETKGRYKKLRDEIAKYKNVKVKSSFKQERVYFGRKTLALLMFRGKTLCIALALNPSEYAETKYRGLDKSGKKRFENTPMLFRVTSSRKAEYAKYLIGQMAMKNKLSEVAMPEKVFVSTVSLPLAELYDRDLVRIDLIGEKE